MSENDFHLSAYSLSEPLIDGAYSVQEALQTLLRAEAACKPLLSKGLPFCFSLISLSAVISSVNTLVVVCLVFC